MQDALTELINQKVDRKIAESDILHSVPAKVVRVLENGMYVVHLLTNGTQMILPNWSVAELDIDENVNVFYKGEIFSERTAYIGSSFNKADIANRNRIIYIKAKEHTGLVPQEGKIVANCTFEVLQTTRVFITFNANIWGSSAGFSFLNLYMDGIAHEYQPKTTVMANADAVQMFTLPFTVAKGSHTMYVEATGVGTYIDIYAFVWGQGLSEKSSFDPTTDAEYIYDNGTVLYYIGIDETQYPEIPSTLGGNAVTKLEATSFCGTEVVAVKIPDGVTRIE